jgi:hypothetical protein
MAPIFLFAGMIAVAGLTAKSIVNWLNARADERRIRERYALLARLAEQPRESTDIVIALLKEDDAKEDMRRYERRLAKRRESMAAGGILTATGIGMTVFLAGLNSSERVWPIGGMIILMGLVLFGFSWNASCGPAPTGRAEK